MGVVAVADLSGAVLGVAMGSARDAFGWAVMLPLDVLIVFVLGGLAGWSAASWALRHPGHG